MEYGRRAAFLLVSAIILTCMPTSGGDSGKKPLFKVGVNTVFVKVSVIDSRNRCVTGLTKENFKIFDDKVEQEISAFRREPSPVSLGILLDTSGSMKSNNNIKAARAALTRFLADVYPEDEFFLITFNQDSVLVSDFTHDAGAVLSAGATGKPKGQTAIWDAVYRGLDKMGSARNDRKALIVITDGEDNSSRYTSSAVREFAKESDSQIYVIGEPGRMGYGNYQIEKIVHLTGGRAFFPGNLNTLDYYIDLIHDELRNQYILGYVPNDHALDGKWHKIRVKLDLAKGLPKLAVRARSGYYAGDH